MQTSSGVTDMAEELKEREAFELQAAMRGLDISMFTPPSEKEYRNPDTQSEWQGWKARAQAASQGGEAVEVVGAAILGGIFHGGSGPELGDIDVELNTDVLERIQAAVVTTSDDVRVELMIVAQHRRILAASVGSSEPVAMKAHGAWDGLDGLANLPDGTKLYTRPADQVAEPDAELVNLLQRASLVMGEAAIRIRHGDDKSCEAKALVEQLASGMQVISAKLADLLP
jgi:hypothetical protein